MLTRTPKFIKHLALAILPHILYGLFSINPELLPQILEEVVTSLSSAMIMHYSKTKP